MDGANEFTPILDSIEHIQQISTLKRKRQVLDSRITPESLDLITQLTILGPTKMI